MHILRSLGAALAALAIGVLSACQLDVPEVESAVLEVKGPSGDRQEYALSARQIEDLSAWLGAHRDGWSDSMASYVPSVLVRAKHSDGSESVMNVLASVVVIYSTHPQMPRQATRKHLPAERSALLKAIEAR